MVIGVILTVPAIAKNARNHLSIRNKGVVGFSIDRKPVFLYMEGILVDTIYKINLDIFLAVTGIQSTDSS